MKKLFLFLAMASTTMFVSCGSDDSDNNSNPPIEEQPTAITLTASASTVQVGTAVVFTVKNNLVPVVDVTASSTFTANNVAFTGGTFTPTEAGTFTIVAKNGTLTSAPFVLTVTAAPVDPQGKFTFDGVDYALGNMGFAVHGANGQITVVNWADEGEPEEWVSLWVGFAFDGADAETSENYYEYFFTLPATVEGETVTEVFFPGEAEATFLQAYAEGDGAELVFDADGGNLTFTSFVLGDDTTPSTSANATSITNAGNEVISHIFDGELVGVSTANLLGDARAARGVKTFSKEAFKSLKSNKMTMVQLKKANR